MHINVFNSTKTFQNIYYKVLENYNNCIDISQ